MDTGMSDQPTSKIKMPPLGLMPKWRWDEIRVESLCAAIHRYTEAGQPVPQAWVDELKAMVPTIRIEYVKTTD
jgi:hypothetical protein